MEAKYFKVTTNRKDTNHQNWFCMKGLHLLETLSQTQERYNAMEVLFTTFNNKFKPQHNETTKSLQFHIVVR